MEIGDAPGTTRLILMEPRHRLAEEDPMAAFRGTVGVQFAKEEPAASGLHHGSRLSNS